MKNYKKCFEGKGYKINSIEMWLEDIICYLTLKRWVRKSVFRDSNCIADDVVTKIERGIFRCSGHDERMSNKC